MQNLASVSRKALDRIIVANEISARYLSERAWKLAQASMNNFEIVSEPERRFLHFLCFINLE